MATTVSGRRIGAVAAVTALAYATYVGVVLQNSFRQLGKAFESGYRVQIESGPGAAAARQAPAAAMPAAAALSDSFVEDEGDVDEAAGEDPGERRRQAFEDLVSGDPEIRALVYDPDPSVRGAVLDFFQD